MILNTTNPITSARKRMRDAFAADPAFEDTYIANIAMLLHDRLDDDRLKDRAFRDKIAKELIKLVFG
jgi:hypothetical protein